MQVREKKALLGSYKIVNRWMFLVKLGKLKGMFSVKVGYYKDVVEVEVK